MTQKRETRKALIMSVLSLVFCFAMLIGSTFAWFTDTASTGVNKIVAGNLDVGLEYSTDMKTWADAENAAEIFGKNANWEPGHTQVLYFRVSNKGSLALQYQVGTNLLKEVTGTSVNGTAINLKDFIKFGIVNTEAAFADSTSARNAVGTPLNFSTTYGEEKHLLPGERTTFAMVVWMPETVGNEANYKPGSIAPSIEFGVNVIATQYAHETDSFGSQYDKESIYPETPKVDNVVANVGTAEELREAIKAASVGGTASGTITINLEKDFDAAGQWEVFMPQNYSGVNTVVINGNNHTISNLNQPLMSGAFGGVGSVTFNDLTIKNANITGDGLNGMGLGAFMAYSDSSGSVTFNNCHLVDSTIIAAGDGETTGEYAGGLIGFSSTPITVKNSSVTNSKITSMKSAGAVIGQDANAGRMDRVKVTGCTINGKYAGTIVGTSNAAASVYSNITATGNNIEAYYGRAFVGLTINGVSQPLSE